MNDRKHLHDIDSLIERFYNGETTREEEVALRRLLDSPGHAEQYKAEREMFDSLSMIEVPDSLEQRLNDTVDALARDERRKSLRVTRWVKRSLAVASSLALLCVIGSGLWQREPVDDLNGMTGAQVEEHTMKALGLIARIQNVSVQTAEDVTPDFEFDF